MRPIEFRAWDKACEVMLMPEEHNKWIMYPNGCSAIDGVWVTGDLELMQFTGLHDKNGVKIFEGDIVKSLVLYFNGNFDAEYELIGKVIFTKWSTFSIEVPKNEQIFQFYETSHLHEPCLEVIGNIHENPELLEAAK